ncbi:hypothetical protein [Bradyrhizobium monzae]|uniref:hypothetical protein n=1 Tax=Bradyrhizobium sp. Oc8 TaxID=2876780 RepID=UPI001F2CA7EB|nr:hypothetical protein [Bradyrhizobium sp. Oc8]
MLAAQRLLAPENDQNRLRSPQNRLRYLRRNLRGVNVWLPTWPLISDDRASTYKIESFLKPGIESLLKPERVVLIVDVYIFFFFFFFLLVGHIGRISNFMLGATASLPPNVRRKPDYRFLRLKKATSRSTLP